MKYRTYNDSEIAFAMSRCDNISTLCKILNISTTSGGSRVHVTKRARKIDSMWNGFQSKRLLVRVGKQCGGFAKIPAERILVKRTNTRERSTRLRRAMIEHGISYICAGCGLEPFWNSKPLKLESEHKDGNCLNCEPSNLEFLCPNCHSQKPVDNKR